MAQRITVTMYVYDWPLLFEKVLQAIWFAAEADSEPEELIWFDEYAPDDDDKLKKMERAPGHNEVAMVVWKVTMKTQSFPGGRSFTLSSNDIASSLSTFRLWRTGCTTPRASGRSSTACPHLPVCQQRRAHRPVPERAQELQGGVGRR